MWDWCEGFHIKQICDPYFDSEAPDWRKPNYRFCSVQYSVSMSQRLKLFNLSMDTIRDEDIEVIPHDLWAENHPQYELFLMNEWMNDKT